MLGTIAFLASLVIAWGLGVYQDNLSPAVVTYRVCGYISLIAATAYISRRIK